MTATKLNFLNLFFALALARGVLGALQVSDFMQINSELSQMQIYCLGLTNEIKDLRGLKTQDNKPIYEH